MEINSVITCPFCNHKENLKMPTDSCQQFIICKKCSKMIKPKENDCCVFCSYGSNKCPSVQEQKGK